MSWMSLNDYVVLEASARDRLDDLHAESRAQAAGDEPPPALVKPDCPRRIDRVIDYFGERPAAAPRCKSDSRTGAWHLACVPPVS